MPVGDPLNSLILHPELWCEICNGKGKVWGKDSLGHVVNTGYDECKSCSGRGVPPIPYCEMGLPEYWGAQ